MIISPEESLSGLFPKPQQITFAGGTADLSSDVRLVTSNVLPLQRKAMRGILTSAGIRVVANKKKFIIETRVVSEKDLNLSNVPEGKLEEYYELEVDQNRIFIRTSTQSGALRGTHTLANIYRLLNADCKIPNMLIQDWPSVACRGFLVPNTWGLDQMDLVDWNLMLDYLASLKLNHAVVELLGPSRTDTSLADAEEFLMLQLPGMEEIKTEVTLNWYSSKHNEEIDEPKAPLMFTEDFLGDVFSYGQEKAVEFVPSLNLGENSLLAKANPKIAAKDKDGKPAERGLCIADSATRDFVVEKLCVPLAEKYPGEDSLPYVVLWLDSRMGNAVGTSCGCKACSSADDFISNLVLLVQAVKEKDIDKVVLAADNEMFVQSVLNSKLYSALSEVNLQQNVLVMLHGAALEKQKVDAEFQHWLSPPLRQFEQPDIFEDMKRLAQFSEMAADNAQIDGLIVDMPLDPIWLDLDAVLADFSWNNRPYDKEPKQTERWLMARFGIHAEQFYAAYRIFQKILQEHDVVRACFCGPECNKAPLAPDFPEGMLNELEQADVLKHLEVASEAAANARNAFNPLVEETDLNDNERLQVRNLLGESAKIEALSSSFSFLLQARAKLAAKQAASELEKGAAPLLDNLRELMSIIEDRKADWIVPIMMHMLRVLCETIENTRVELKEL